MNKVYAVMNNVNDYRHDEYGEPNLLRIFDNREKADEYIINEFRKLGLTYEYISQNDTYECELDWGDIRVMYVDEHDVY